jgi:hypothetical protein
MRRKPRAAGGHNQHQSLRSRVVDLSRIEPGLLGPDQPLHSGQRNGHHQNLVGTV